VFEKFRERLAVHTHAARRFDVDRFTVKELRELEVRKYYQIKIKRVLEF
jgi:hypothetical protein